MVETINGSFDNAILHGLSGIFTLLGAVGAAYLLFAGWCVQRFTSQPLGPSLAGPSRDSQRFAKQGVSVLKPLHGAPLGLLEDLRTFCQQDFPLYEVIFGVQRADDPAVKVFEALRIEFPKLTLKLVVAEPDLAKNPKVANLMALLPVARYPTVVIADSDIAVVPLYIATVIAPLVDPAVGIVTCLYRGMAGGGLWSALAAMHINYTFLPQALVGQTVHAGGGCFGATLALRRETLDNLGGFAAIGDYLADDHALGDLVRAKGLRVVLSPVVVDTRVEETSLSGLFAHELRWARTVRFIAPLGYAGSLVTHAVALAFVGLAFDPTSSLAVTVLMVVLFCRVITATLIAGNLRLSVSAPGLFVVRDFLSLGVFIASFASRRVRWGQRLLLVDRQQRIINEATLP